VTEERDEVWVSVGFAGRSHGRDGSFVVEQASERAEQFGVGSKLYVDRKESCVVSSKIAGGRVVVKLDIPVLQGTAIEIRKSELPILEENSYYVFQLVGLVVFTEGGMRLGRIVDVLSKPANDVIELEDGALLPLVRSCVIEVNSELNRVVISESFAPGS
tara:strand:- start:492 stop:971 length:480 start_codon:yes stop_codon:yes gene_type:complete